MVSGVLRTSQSHFLLLSALFFLVKFWKFRLGQARLKNSNTDLPLYQYKIWLLSEFQAQKYSTCFAQNAGAAGVAYVFDIKPQNSELTQANPVNSGKLSSLFLLMLADLPTP